MVERVEQTVSLGPDGPRLRPLGVGTWQWGSRFLWGYGRQFGADDLRGAFEAALAERVTLFDTAEVYGRGRSERMVGQLNRQSGGRALLATKFMPLPWRRRKDDLRRALEGSLRRLGVERIGLYQIHWPNPLVPIETWMEALAEAWRDGLVEAIGVSNYSAAQTRRAAAALERRGARLASNQISYSLLERRVERNGTLAACRELGVTPIAYSPIGMGLLGGRYSAKRPPPDWRRLYYLRQGPARVDRLVGLLRELGQARGKTPAQVALNWLICQGAIPIPGAKNADQARANAGAIGWCLSADELAVLDRASPPR
jgi:aryl-alcohol dehydrogenase-like predicted oxidoreductase